MTLSERYEAQRRLEESVSRSLSEFRLGAAKLFLAEAKALRRALADEHAWMLAGHDPGDEDRS